MAEKYALIIDGGFLKNKLRRYTPEQKITAQYVVEYCQQLHEAHLNKYELFRIYYYDCNPFRGKISHPITGAVIDYSKNPQASNQQAIIDNLELRDNFAVRKGQILQPHDWILKSPDEGELKLEDISGRLKLHVTQKQVDMKIGLDIAWLSSKKIVDRIVLVAGDTDFIPAMKFARKEGLIVYLNLVQQNAHPTLKIHSDYVLDFPTKDKPFTPTS